MPCGSPHQCSLRLGHQKTSKEPKTQHQLPEHVFTLKTPFWHFLRQRVVFYCSYSDYESKNLFVMCHLQAKMNMYMSPNCQFFSAKFHPSFHITYENLSLSKAPNGVFIQADSAPCACVFYTCFCQRHPTRALACAFFRLPACIAFAPVSLE